MATQKKSVYIFSTEIVYETNFRDFREFCKNSRN